MSLFNVTTNMTNLIELLPLADSFTGGLLGLTLLIVVFFGTLIIFSGSKDSLIAASFVSFVVAFPLKYLNMLSDLFLWLPAVVLTIALMISILAKRGGGSA